MPITPGIHTFSTDRLYSVWQDLRDPKSKSRTPYGTYPLSSHESRHALGSTLMAQKLCLGLFRNVAASETHLTQLDANYEVVYSPRRSHRPIDERDVFDRAIQMLNQLPATSPNIYGALLCDTWPASGFFISNVEDTTDLNPDPQTTWDRLAVVNHVDTVVLRTVLMIAQCEIFREQHHKPDPAYPIFMLTMNSTMLLLKTSVDFAVQQRQSGRQWLVVCAFLWTSWQRLSTLLHRELVLEHLQGFDLEIGGYNTIRAGDLLPDIFEYRKQSQQKELDKTPYLCPWAFSTLINDRAMISTDLRRFFQIYRSVFGPNKAACNPGPTQCNGKSSLSCQRFEQSNVTNQSLHSSTCAGSCKRLFWNRHSFVSVLGPKAVDLNADNSSSLRYCESTGKTMTISHVWSHGQGGRPDQCGVEGTGFNSCLHERYAKIALSLGFDSYWMDTPCIPSEKELRWDCISNITKIFAMSEITLVCDRDIMTIDISSPTPLVCEQILATLLVCDWNMRAWTLLESVKGRYNLFLLCRDEKIISLQEVLRTVCTRGNIDLAIPFCTRPYLLPPYIPEHMSLFDNGESLYTDEDIEQSKILTVAEAAVLLSCRHATRDDDVLLIWNILVGNREVDDPVELWRKQIGKQIPTACLISSAPRLEGVQGFHWAPCRPNMSSRQADRALDVKEFPAHDGSDSKNGIITDEGLLAVWQGFKFPADGIESNSCLPVDSRDDTTSYHQQLQVIVRDHLLGFKEGIVLRPLHARGPWTFPWPYRASSNHLLAVCGSEDGVGWIWKGIYEWHRTIPLPPFERVEVLLI